MDDLSRDERAERRDQRKASSRAMKKHGARTAALYRNAILKRLRRRAGKRAR